MSETINPLSSIARRIKPLMALLALPEYNGSATILKNLMASNLWASLKAGSTVESSSAGRMRRFSYLPSLCS
jgi:hypothetical protein